MEDGQIYRNRSSVVIIGLGKKQDSLRKKYACWELFFFRFRDANLSTVINEKNGRRILTSCRADKEYGPEVLSPHTQSQGLFGYSNEGPYLLSYAFKMDQHLRYMHALYAMIINPQLPK